MSYHNERVAKLPDTITETKSKEKILRKLEGHFHEAIRDQSWKDFLKNGVKVSDYKENNQWTDEEIEELVEVRRQPLYINNQVKVTIDFLNGQFAQIKTRVGARPRNGQADQKSADTLSDIFRYIYQNNCLEFEERDCADDGFTLGRGVLDVQVGFDDAFQPEISVRWEDTLSVHPDPHSRHYDWNEDALYVCRSKWVDVDKAVELHPESETELRGLLGGEDPAHGDLLEKDRIEGNKEMRLVDTDRNRIRLVEVQYKKFKREIVWVTDDTTIREEDITEKEALKAGHLKLIRVTHKIFVGVFTEGILLAHDPTEKERFSFIQFLVHRKRSGEPYGPAWPALPLQDSINKRGSKAMHLLNSRGVIYERTAVTDKDALSEELAKPDFQIELNEGGKEKFEFVEHKDLAAAHMQFHDSDLQNFRRVTGINPDALGEKSEIRSGIGVARKVAQTKTVSAGAFDNFRRTRQATFLTVLDCIQHYYTPRKIELVTDDTEAALSINLDADSLASIKQGKYDIVIAEMPDLVNTEEEQFQVLSNLLPTMSQTSPFWARMLLKASSLRDKDKFIKQLDALPKGPQIQPKMTISAQLDNMSPVERAYLYQQMGAAEVAQAVMQENRPTSNMIKLQSEQMKLQAAQAKTQATIQQAEMKLRTEQASAELKMEVEDAKTQAAVVKSKLDIVLAQMDLEKQKLEIEKAELGIEKAEVDVEKATFQAKTAEKKSKESKSASA